MNLDFFWQFNHRQTDLTFIVKFCRFETFQVCWSMIFCRKQRTRRAIGTNYNYSGFFLQQFDYLLFLYINFCPKLFIKALMHCRFLFYYKLWNFFLVLLLCRNPSLFRSLSSVSIVPAGACSVSLTLWAHLGEWLWNLCVSLSFQQEFVLRAVLHIASVYNDRRGRGWVIGGWWVRKTEIKLNNNLIVIWKTKYHKQIKVNQQ